MESEAFFINCMTIAPRTNNEEKIKISSKKSTASNEDHASSPDKKPGQKYAVDRIVDHAETKNGVRYRVRWNA